MVMLHLTCTCFTILLQCEIYNIHWIKNNKIPLRLVLQNHIPFLKIGSLHRKIPYSSPACINSWSTAAYQQTAQQPREDNMQMPWLLVQCCVPLFCSWGVEWSCLSCRSYIDDWNKNLTLQERWVRPFHGKNESGT